MAPAPASFPANEPRRRSWKAAVALAAVVLLTVCGAYAVRRVQALRAQASAAREAALVLDRELGALAEAWIVEQLDGAEPTALALGARTAEERVAVGEFAAAPTEEIALSIRVGAALRDAGELDAATARLQRALSRAIAAGDGPWDRLLGRTAAEPDHAPAARAELARVHLARADARTALQLALEAWNAPRSPDVLEKRTSAVADRALLIAEILDAQGETARATEFARTAVEESPARDRAHAHVRWRALQFLAIAAKDGGRTAEAIELHRTALSAARWGFVDDDPRTATSRYELAYLLHDEGPRAADEALREYARSLDVRLARAHGDRAQLATHMSNYALLLKQTGRLSEAEPVSTRALEMQRRLVPGESAATATMMNNLGTLRHALGDYAGSESMLADSLAMRRRLFPDGHADVAQSLQNLAWLRQDLAEYEDAVVLGREAVAILERVSPTEDVDFAIALDNLGGALTDTKDYAEAETVTRRALAIEERLLSGDHKTRAQTLDNLGVILYWRKDLEESEERLTAALAMRRALYGMDHPDVAATRRHLAWVAERRGQREKAVEHYRAAKAALDGSTRDPGLAAEVGNELADCQRDLGDVPRALETFRATLATALKDPARCAWPIADSAEGVAACAGSLGRRAEVEAELVRAAEVVLSTDGFFLHARARTIEALRGLYDSWVGTAAEVERARRSSARWRERLDEADGF